MNKRYLIKKTLLDKLHEDSLELLLEVDKIPGIQLFDRAWIIFKNGQELFIGREVTGFAKVSQTSEYSILDTVEKGERLNLLKGDLDRLITEHDALCIDGDNIFSLNWC